MGAPQQSGLRKWRRLSLGQHAARVFVKGPRLRKCFDALLHLRIVLELHLIARRQAEDRDKNLLLDLPPDPVDIRGYIRIGETDVLLFQKRAESRKDRVINLKVFGDLRLGAEEIRREIADATFVWKENFVAKQVLLKVVGLGLRDDDVRRNAIAAENLPAAIGQLHFGRLGILVIIEVVVKGDVLVIALDEPPAGRVI